MSSPQINNLIIAGCILSYTSVLLMGIDSTLLGKKSSEAAMNFICAVCGSFLFASILFHIDYRSVYGHYLSVLRYHLGLYLVKHGVYIQYLPMLMHQKEYE